jgi:hypothetical protein
MSVLTIVQRAFPFALPWKRRPSTDKGKEKEIDIEIYTSDRDSHEHIHFGTYEAENGNEFPSTTFSPKSASLQCDVSHTLHIAVKPSPDHTTSPEDSLSESSETDSDSESQFDDDIRRQPSHGSSASSSTRGGRLARVVSWASIVRSRCRWTNEQEKQLLMAEKQLARCQKAWSSEQELWLTYVRVLISLVFLCVEVDNGFCQDTPIHTNHISNPRDTLIMILMRLSLQLRFKH